MTGPPLRRLGPKLVRSYCVRSSERAVPRWCYRRARAGRRRPASCSQSAADPLYAQVEQRRFRHKRRAFGQLRHVGIARLVEGVINDVGTPYIALELVHGKTLPAHARRHQLDIAARLRLCASASMVAEDRTDAIALRMPRPVQDLASSGEQGKRDIIVIAQPLRRRPRRGDRSTAQTVEQQRLGVEFVEGVLRACCVEISASGLSGRSNSRRCRGARCAPALSPLIESSSSRVRIPSCGPSGGAMALAVFLGSSVAFALGGYAFGLHAQPERPEPGRPSR